MEDNEYKIEWDKPHILKFSNEIECKDEINDDEKLKFRKIIEPWLTAVFQSDHLSLLVGTGLTAAISSIAEIESQGMNRINFSSEFKDNIKRISETEAKSLNRGNANIEDDLRIAIELHKGLIIQEQNEKAKELEDDINSNMSIFIKNVLKTENEFIKSRNYSKALSILKSLLISFASRTASRDRLNILTTNYDRFIEFACDKAGVLILDSFAGKINPIFRTNKIALDYHYNPPGIRGEPRYVEGVIRYTKLHGSLDWLFDDSQIVKSHLPFGADENHSSVPKAPFNQVVIYPNSSKNIETVYFPYAELFRDFSIAVCQPNSTLVTYGYGFGDTHINRVLEDMLTIPSTHIVIISWDTANGRIQKFVDDNNHAQFTLLIGNHFGDLETLVENYLPKAAIDRISIREKNIRDNRVDRSSSSSMSVTNEVIDEI